MNINHAIHEKIEGDMLKAIFDRQKSLMEKYHHIEAHSGLLQTEDCPVNLDDRRGQARIKDFSWRITEELGEALDAKSHSEHYQEELIDGLHFLTEMTILAGRDYDTLIEVPSKEPQDHLKNIYNLSCDEVTDTGMYSLNYWVAQFIENLAMMCNCLKNKPWKQSMMKTDKEAFYSRLVKSWICYMAILASSGLEPSTIADIYLRKSQVNQFRQRSNY